MSITADPQNKSTISVNKYLAAGVVDTSLGAAAGMGITHLLSLGNPIGGLIFGATSAATSFILSPLLDQVFGNSTTEKIAKFIINLLANIAVGLIVATLAGYTFTIGSILLLSLTIGVVKFVSVVAIAHFCGKGEDEVRTTKTVK